MAAPISTFVNLRWAFAAGGVVWTALQVYIIQSFGFSWAVALTDGIISSVALGAACWLIDNTLRFYQPSQNSYLNLLIWCGLLAGLCLAISRFALPQIITDAEYYGFVVKSMVIRYFTDFLAIGWMAMISLVWYAQQDHKENEKRKAEAEKLAKEAELFNLRQQLQPHFLFNSLNSINALIGFKPEEARKMVQQLSDFLRGTLKKDDQQLTSLSDELQHLQLYLDIEKVRFGHRLQTEISCDGECGKALLPPLLLQPVVENAIKFGLYDTTGSVTVSIRGEMDDNYLVIIVQNPYDPQTAKPRQGTGFGLSGMKRRLHLIYTRNDLVETFVNDDIFTTIIKIPQV
ncbi:histidine kinase [Mucilaginibacter sp. RS28]|uniref:Histidine kinase n=1 Tax=Mucilaginibacter straminoryzae TaxID=2932774 RepID=A0A9X2BAG4_9SPHI|nr:histidine kinase [Mucilaginibacter straminoryzae]MCJ8208757.1 histidine kinase [Mucilaginibacter straminoryzae]